MDISNLPEMKFISDFGLNIPESDLGIDEARIYRKNENILFVGNGYKGLFVLNIENLNNIDILY